VSGPDSPPARVSRCSVSREKHLDGNSAVDFQNVIANVLRPFELSGGRYALMGGFAMAMHGVQRATMDLNLLILLEDMGKADALLRQRGYELAFRSANVSHYQSEDWEWGRIDVLHAFRAPSRAMLERAERVAFGGSGEIPVVRVEDLIGLKVQAVSNDPSRGEGDWADIALLIEAAALGGRALDWELIADYLALFGRMEKLTELRKRHGSPE
jgi:hypothetical protein